MGIDVKHLEKQIFAIQIDAAEHLKSEYPEFDRANRSERVQRIAERVNNSPFSIHYSPSYWSLFSTHNTTIIETNRQPKTEEEQKKDEAHVATWIGIAALAILSFAMGFLLKSFFAAKTKETSSSSLKTELRLRLGEKGELPKVLELIWARHKIDLRNYKNVRNQFAAVSVGVIGATCAIAGGLMLSSTLITAGYATLVASSVLLLFNLGYHWGDAEQNRKNYLQIVGYHFVSEEGIKQEGLAEAAIRELREYMSQQPIQPSKEQQNLGQPGESESQPGESPLATEYQPLYPKLPILTRPSAPDFNEIEGLQPNT